MQRFRSLPITVATCLVGHIAASALRNLLATAIVIGVGVLLGFRPAAALFEWLVAGALMLAWILAITVIFAAIGLLASSPETANGYGFGILFLPYISSAFVPLDTLPNWLQPIAGSQPVTPLTDALRALLFGTSPGAALWFALAWCFGIVIAGAVLIIWRFPRN